MELEKVFMQMNSPHHRGIAPLNLFPLAGWPEELIRLNKFFVQKLISFQPYSSPGAVLLTLPACWMWWGAVLELSKETELISCVCIYLESDLF